MSYSESVRSYTGERFTDIDFTDASLPAVTFVKCDFRGVVLSGALLEKCRFSACAFDFARLNDTLCRSTALPSPEENRGQSASSRKLSR